jgi:DNA-binding transcriptional LysR family regulator
MMEVDRCGSYSVAALHAGVSQPAIYRAISELSDMVGVPLMVRRGKAVQPTVAATRMLRLVRLARAELQAGLDELDALRPEGAGRIIFGALPVARAVLLPQVLARFARAHPMASVTVAEGPYDELMGHLRDGDLDFVVGAMRAVAIPSWWRVPVILSPINRSTSMPCWRFRGSWRPPVRHCARAGSACSPSAGSCHRV